MHSHHGTSVNIHYHGDGSGLAHLTPVTPAACPPILRVPAADLVTFGLRDHGLAPYGPPGLPLDDPGVFRGPGGTTFRVPPDDDEASLVIVGAGSHLPPGHGPDAVLELSVRRTDLVEFASALSSARLQGELEQAEAAVVLGLAVHHGIYARYLRAVLPDPPDAAAGRPDDTGPGAVVAGA